MTLTKKWIIILALITILVPTINVSASSVTLAGGIAYRTSDGVAFPFDGVTSYGSNSVGNKSGMTLDSSDTFSLFFNKFLFRSDSSSVINQNENFCIKIMPHVDFSLGINYFSNHSFPSVSTSSWRISDFNDMTINNILSSFELPTLSKIRLVTYLNLTCNATTCPLNRDFILTNSDSNSSNINPLYNVLFTYDHLYRIGRSGYGNSTSNSSPLEIVSCDSVEWPVISSDEPDEPIESSSDSSSSESSSNSEIITNSDDVLTYAFIFFLVFLIAYILLNGVLV